METVTAFAIEEIIPRLFTPDILIGDRFDSTRQPRRHQTPEHALSFAVLQDAIYVLSEKKLTRLKQRNLYYDTLKWVKSERGDFIFSFVGICETLGLEPGYVRRGILKKHTALDKKNRVRL